MALKLGEAGASHLTPLHAPENAYLKVFFYCFPIKKYFCNYKCFVLNGLPARQLNLRNLAVCHVLFVKLVILKIFFRSKLDLIEWIGFLHVVQLHMILIETLGPWSILVLLVLFFLII